MWDKQKLLKSKAKYRASHKKEIRRYYQDNKAHFQEYARNYRVNHKEQHRINNKKWNETHKEAVSAKHKAARHIPLDAQCKICSSSINLHRHHPDYSKPLQVVTLCCSCHFAVHSGQIMMPEGC